MQSRFLKLLLFLTGIVLVIKIQEASSMDHKYVIQTWKGNSPNENLFNENKIINSQHEVSTVLQRTKRQAGYNDRNRRYPYPIPIFGGGGYDSRGFGERGFGSRGFGARGFGSRGFGSKGFGARGFGSRGFGARGFGGRGIGGIGRGIGGFGGRGRG